MYKHFFKRLIDLILSAIGIVVLAIPMIVIGIVVKLDSPGPVLFRQERAGKDKQAFHILKFRSMRTDAPKDAPTDKLQNAESWITKSGAFLRKTSLDELPQLFNIFCGQMAIVGPRPALFNQEELLELRDANGSNALRPGLTGWAQINGRDELADDVKAAYDGEYTKKISFIFDCKCFFATIGKVFKREGIVEGGKNK